jgi:hypothetical protein
MQLAEQGGADPQHLATLAEWHARRILQPCQLALEANVKGPKEVVQCTYHKLAELLPQDPVAFEDLAKLTCEPAGQVWLDGAVGVLPNARAWLSGSDLGSSGVVLPPAPNEINVHHSLPAAAPAVPLSRSSGAQYMVRLIRTVTAAAGLREECSQAQGHWAYWEEASRRNTLATVTAQFHGLRRWHCSMESQLSEVWHADWIEGGAAACERVLTNAYRVIDLVVDEIKCQWVGVADSIMERLEEGLPPRNLIESPSILTDKGMQSALATHLGSSGLAQVVASATAVLGPAFEALFDPRPCVSQ